MNALRITGRILLVIGHACVMLALGIASLMVLALFGALHNPRDG